MKRRILFVITDLNFGGAEVMLRNLLTQLDRETFEFEVVSLQETGPVGEQIGQMGIHVHALGMDPQKPQFKAILLLVKIIRNFRPDLINTWMYHADLMGSVAALFSGFPPVIWGLHHTVGDQEELKFSTRQIIRLNRWLSHLLPKRIVCCAEATRRSHADIGFCESKMVVITNGYDLDIFRPDPTARSMFRKDHNLSADAQLVGLFARYHPMKDHSTFIQAAKIIQQQMPNVFFVMVGSEIDNSNRPLNSEIDRAGIRSSTILLGLRKDISALLAALDLYVSSSSRGEAFPMIIGEAMACGVPCVATDVGDSARIISSIGRIVPPGQPETLAAAAMEILTFPSEERDSLGRAARARVEAEYNLSIIAQKYMRLYHDVCKDRKHDER
jgi:glycosyltransferase involved in cell wall biosynthesis